jgi:WD40 repeat protein
MDSYITLLSDFGQISHKKSKICLSPNHIFYIAPSSTQATALTIIPFSNLTKPITEMQQIPVECHPTEIGDICCSADGQYIFISELDRSSVNKGSLVILKNETTSDLTHCHYPTLHKIENFLGEYSKLVCPKKKYDNKELLLVTNGASCEVSLVNLCDGKVLKKISLKFFHKNNVNCMVAANDGDSVFVGDR